MENNDIGKKSKKSSKRRLLDGNDKVMKKLKKKARWESLSSESDIERSPSRYSGKFPDWLDMTDSEDQFEKPKEKKKKKRKIAISAEEAEVYTNEKGKKHSKYDEPEAEVKLEISPKKKKKQPVEVAPVVIERDRPCPKRFKKSLTPMEFKENGDVSDFPSKTEEKISRKTSKDTESTAEVPRKDAAFRKKEKSPKKEPKAPTNLFSEHDELPNDVEKFSEAYPEVLEKPVEVTAKSSPKKKHPKKLPKTTENLADHDELPSDANEFSQAPHQEFREPVEATIKSSSSESSAKARSPSKPSEKNIEEQKHDPSQAPKEPPKRPVKKITKVPAAELVTLGEEYKIKKVNEKPCRDCNEPVKIKMKTRVRDMGTQTIESAVMNGLRTRGRPKGPPKVKKQDPVSVKDRIITPRQPTDQDEFIDMHHKPKPLTQEQIEQLRSMTVSLKHPVPPQHDVEVTAGCRPLTSEEKENFKAFETLKIGVWRVEEDRTIVKNWKKFCKRHSWNPDITAPFTSWRHKGAYYIPQMDERKKFLQFLAHGLSNRSLYNVYMRFKNLYSTHRIERYSPLEDATLMAEIENNPNFDKTKYLSQLAEKLNRTRHSIWRRYQILKKKAEAADDV